MMIRNKLPNDGRILFKWRSFAPLVLLFPGALALMDGPEIERVYGEGAEELWMALSFAVSLSGLAIRWATVGFIPAGTSGRNTKRLRADCLNTTGMYSVCRNPLYLGNFVSVFGVVLAFQNPWLALVSILAYWLYIERVVAAEEEYLAEKYGEAYQKWSAQTPVIIPKMSLWKNADLAFSFKTVLKREYSGFLAVFACFYAFEFFTDVVLTPETVQDWFSHDWYWSAMMAFGLGAFFVLRLMKKYTRALKVEGR